MKTMSSLYTIGQMYELATAFEQDGYTPEMLKSLVSGGRLRALKEVLEGNAQIVTISTKVAKPKPSILEFVSTVKIPATTGSFVAKAKFVVNITDEASVKISYVWENFREWFLNGDGKTEGPTDEQTLSYAKLRKASVDAPIIAELGGEEKSETTLSEMFSLMEKQGKGEAGVLLNNGYANIFYVRDSAGMLRAVGVRWYDGGWDVFAYSVLDAGGWGDGDQVFSRNSVVLESSETLVSVQA